MIFRRFSRSQAQNIWLFMVLNLAGAMLSFAQETQEAEEIQAPPEPIIEENPADILWEKAEIRYKAGRYANKAHSNRQRQRFLETSITYLKKFINNYPKDSRTQLAWFRMGEAYYYRKEFRRAGTVYKRIIKKYKTGRLVGGAAIRLAEIRSKKEDWKEAARHYDLACKQDLKPKVRIRTLNLYARCLIKLGKSKKAIKVLTQLADYPVEINRHRNQALFALGYLNFFQEKNYDQSLIFFKKLDSPLVNKNIRVEALLYAGLSHLKLDRPKEAEVFLKQALALGDLKRNIRGEAANALMQLHFDKENYQGVLDIFSQSSIENNADPVVQTQLLLIAGKANAKLTNYQSAISNFTAIERIAPSTTVNFEAGYRRLECFYGQGSTTVPDQVDNFIQIYKRRKPQSLWIHKALQLKAESLYEKGEYVKAAKAYNRIDPKKLEERYRSEYVYKLGWSLALSGDYSRAIQAFTQFVKSKPRPAEKEFLSALSKRGECYQKLSDNRSALSDFQNILNNSEASEYHPFATQQTARIYRKNRKYASMIEAYTKLLKNSSSLSQDAIANAQYWIGWGWFKLEKYAHAIPFLEKARESVPEFYKEDAGSHIVMSHFILEDEEGLKNAIYRLHEDTPNTVLPNSMLIWLGLQLRHKGHFKDADHFLTLSSDTDDPSSTELNVWRHIAKSRIKIGHYDRALEAITILLDLEKEPIWRADTYQDQAKAYLGKKEPQKAEKSIRQGLALKTNDLTKANLLLLAGDVDMAKKKYDLAASKYLQTVEMFVEGSDMKLKATERAILAYQKAGLTDQAELFSSQLRKQYPNWKPPKETDQ